MHWVSRGLLLLRYLPWPSYFPHSAEFMVAVGADSLSLTHIPLHPTICNAQTIGASHYTLKALGPQAPQQLYVTERHVAGTKCPLQ